MLAVYDSLTGNVKRFMKKIDLPTIQLVEDLEIQEEFVLITYTTGFGLVPEKTKQFLTRNHQFLRGVAASGNRNWGANFAVSADKIASRYHVPIVSKFELAGTQKDVERFMKGVGQLEIHRIK